MSKKITTADKIALINFEMNMTRVVYPKKVEQKRITQDVYLKRMATLVAMKEDYEKQLGQQSQIFDRLNQDHHG